MSLAALSIAPAATAHSGTPGSAGIAPPTVTEAPREAADVPAVGTPDTLALEFTGTASAYFRIWIVNLALTLVTLGVYSAWAKVRKQRYLYGSTLLDGSPFHYLGQPLPVLKGRVVAVLLLGTYWVASEFVPSLLPAVLIAGLVIAPWVVSRSARFAARNTQYRGMTFGFTGGYADAAKALYGTLVVPAFIVGTAFEWWRQPVLAGIGATIFFGGLPFLLMRMKRFVAAHTTFGGWTGDCSAQGGSLYWIYVKAGLLMVPLMVVCAILFGALAQASGAPSMATLQPVATVCMGAVYLASLGYIRARSLNLVWNHLTLGPVRFAATARAFDFATLYATNAVALALTLGLATPWAVVRTLRYRIAHTQVIADGDLESFRTESGTATIGAAGAETAELFDLELSL